MTQRRVYQKENPYLITTNTVDKYPCFCDFSFATILSQNIFSFEQEYDFSLFGYCIMPDHLHLILQEGPNHNISDIMRAIKSKTTTDLYKKDLWKDKLWQARFDHRILPDKTALFRALSYLRENPDKEGLENQYRTFPYLYISAKP